jgi:hypothetical protein
LNFIILLSCLGDVRNRKKARVLPTLKEGWPTTYDVHGHGTFGAEDTLATDLKFSYTTFGTTLQNSS